MSPHNKPRAVADRFDDSQGQRTHYLQLDGLAGMTDGTFGRRMHLGRLACTTRIFFGLEMPQGTLTHLQLTAERARVLSQALLLAAEDAEQAALANDPTQLEAQP